MAEEITESSETERIKKLGFIPQNENVYNKLLPYADELDEESNKLLLDIKTNLIKSVLAREMRPGCALWTSRLNKYMKIYGLKFSKEDHIAFIKLFYELLTIPNLAPTRISQFASTLSFLLKKRRLLSRDDLQLDWRPLYKLSVKILEKSKTEVGIFRYRPSLEGTICTVIRNARIYFPASATQEILDEFRPMFCPFSSRDITVALQYLEMLLPVCVKPEEAAISYELWVTELMQLWEVCHNASNGEIHMAWLIARLASFNTGRIDWEPYLPIMYGRFLRILRLPVAYKKKQTIKQFTIDVSAMTLWIVSTLGGGKEPAFFHLEKFMQTLESYFHPANTGSWSCHIRNVLCKLSYYFVQRVHKERHKKPSWEADVPDNMKLTDEEITRFVNIMKPSIEHATFSRQGLQDVRFATQYLASLRPDIIVPITLEKLYASMDSLTEPHKLTFSMMSVMAVARYMVQGAKYNYPEGPTHVIPLLLGLLPGIDPNDVRKCYVTFNFMVLFVNMCPLVNSSEASLYYDDLTEEEHIVCEATANFEDFVLQLFDKLCLWVESNSLEFTRLEQVVDSSTSKKNRSEAFAEDILRSFIFFVLEQCSPEIFMEALKKIYNFATNHILEVKVSGRMVAVICQCFAKVNAKETLKLFLPYLFDRIETLLEENENSKAERLDDELLYNMLLLSEIFDGRSEILNYIDRINVILEKTLHMVSMQGSRFAARTLGLVITSLTFPQPTEYRSCNKPYDLHVKDFLTVREWGVAGKLKDLNISWYVPGEKEIRCVQDLLNKYLVPEIDKLALYSKGELSLTRDNIRQSLNVVKAILAAQTVLPGWKEPALQLVDSVLDPWAFELIVGGPHIVTMPDGSNVRKTIADTVHEVQKKILEVDEGDTLSIRKIILIYEILLFNKYRHKDFESHWKNFHMIKKTFEDRVHMNKQHLRHILVDRAMLQHEFRNESRSCSFTETHRQILLDLFQLGVSRYSEIRILAQAKLHSAISYFPYSYMVLSDKIKEILKMDSIKHHEMFKGCLYILLGPKGTPIIAKHDWKFLGEVWLLLIRSQPSEKPSIVNLINLLSDAIQRCFPTIAIKVCVPEKCLTLARELQKGMQIDLEGFREIIENSEENLRQKSFQLEKTYNETVARILDACVNGKLHWLYHTLALNCIQMLVHVDVNYTPEVVQYFLKALINDSLAVRKIAIKVVMFIMMQNKPKFKKIVIDPYEIAKCGKDKSKPTPGIRKDNEWLLYNSKTAPKTSDEWEQPRYVHNQFTGYYTWPKLLEVYAPSYEQDTAAKRLDKLSGQEKEIYDFFTSESNMDLLIRYLSLEEKKGWDHFSTSRFFVFKNLFKLFEDSLLDNFLPHLQKLVTDKQEQHQRCAAEIISGIMCASKHWSYLQVERLWTEFIPLLHSATLNMYDETLADWNACIAVTLECRDPNRYHWLFEYLMNDPLAEQTSFLACGRLYLLYNALQQQSWRNAEMYHRVLEYLKGHLTHPFQNVRDKISSCLTAIFAVDIQFPNGSTTNCPRIKDFFVFVMPRLNRLYNDCLKKVEGRNGSEGEGTKNEMNHLNIDLLKTETQQEDIRLFKVVARYITSSIVRLKYSVVPEFIELIPLVTILQSNDTDDELESICSSLLAVLANSLILDKYIPCILQSIETMAKCPFWTARASIAEFLEVLVFHNMAAIISNKEWVMKVQKIVLMLLEDPQPEVRTKASSFLSGLLHCQFVPSPQELLNYFKDKAKTKLKRSHGKEVMHNIGGNGLIQTRHAGVLGLCAFVKAHPYDVPDYLPEVFGHLGPHLTDPQPIPATIRKTLEDFKRTHHDNWEVHKLKFTEEELLLLSDLTVPPSYYA